jgi:uncharacterized phage-associated protein
MGICSRKKDAMSHLRRKYLKALETLVYVANKETRLYWALKIIYFANIEHLQRYGRQIFDEGYRAMKQGPVPSLAYDIVKNVRGDGWYEFKNPDPSTAIKTPDRYTILPQRKANIDLLSKTDMECLDYAHDLIKGLSFGQLKEKSHDTAYRAVEQDEEMSIEDIVRTLDNGEEILDYLTCN